MVSQRICLVGVIQKDHCPLSGQKALGFFQFGGRSPDWDNKVINIFLHSRDELVEIDLQVDSGLIEAGDCGLCALIEGTKNRFLTHGVSPSYCSELLADYN